MTRTAGAGTGISAATPLIALDVVVLDTEATGLNIRSDRLVQNGAVRLHGTDIDEAATFDQLLDPGMPVPKIAARIHGLTDAELAEFRYGGRGAACDQARSAVATCRPGRSVGQAGGWSSSGS